MKFLPVLIVVLSAVSVRAADRERCALLEQAALNTFGVYSALQGSPTYKNDITALTEAMWGIIQLFEERRCYDRPVSEVYLAAAQTLLADAQERRQAAIKHFGASEMPDEVQTMLRRLNQLSAMMQQLQKRKGRGRQEEFDA